MIQKGIVLKTAAGRALVSVSRPSACGHACATCSAHCTAKAHNAWAQNTMCAKPGDVVLVASDDKAVLTAVFFVYVLPLLLFFAGYITSYAFLNNTAFSIIISLFMMSVSFVLLRLLDKRMAPTVTITEILIQDTEKRNSAHGI